jgi:hypothetical protein
MSGAFRTTRALKAGQWTRASIDELEAATSDAVVTAAESTRSIKAMHFYDSCIVFERGTPPRPTRKIRRRAAGQGSQ